MGLSWGWGSCLLRNFSSRQREGSGGSIYEGPSESKLGTEGREVIAGVMDSDMGERPQMCRGSAGVGSRWLGGDELLVPMRSGA